MALHPLDAAPSGKPGDRLADSIGHRLFSSREFCESGMEQLDGGSGQFESTRPLLWKKKRGDEHRRLRIPLFCGSASPSVGEMGEGRARLYPSLFYCIDRPPHLGALSLADERAAIHAAGGISLLHLAVFAKRTEYEFRAICSLHRLDPFFCSRLRSFYLSLSSSGSEF